MELISRQMCLAQHVGTKETMFGGQMLAWADIAASVWCAQLSRSDSLLTVHMSDIDFLSPVRVGDLVEFWGEGYNLGRTSVKVRIVVKVYEPRSGETHECFRFTAVMVNVDRNLRATPLLAEVQGKSSNWAEG